MLTVGKLETEDYLCVNTEKHDRPKFFDTADLMRAHQWGDLPRHPGVQGGFPPRHRYRG